MSNIEKKKVAILGGHAIPPFNNHGSLKNIDKRTPKEIKSNFIKNHVDQYISKGHNKSVAVKLAKMAWKTHKRGN